MSNSSSIQLKRQSLEARTGRIPWEHGVPWEQRGGAVTSVHRQKPPVSWFKKNRSFSVHGVGIFRKLMLKVANLDLEDDLVRSLKMNAKHFLDGGLNPSQKTITSTGLKQSISLNIHIIQRSPTNRRQWQAVAVPTSVDQTK